MSNDDVPPIDPKTSRPPLARLARHVGPQVAAAVALLAAAIPVAHDDPAHPELDRPLPTLAQRLQPVLGVTVGAGRPLSAGEVAETRPIFGEQLDYGAVRVRPYDSALIRGGSKALLPAPVFTAGTAIYVPTFLYEADYAGRDDDPIPHELTHEWQHQKKGLSLVAQAARLLAETWGHDTGARSLGSTTRELARSEWTHRHDSGSVGRGAAALVAMAGDEYGKAYQPDRATPFSRQNIEQQAVMVETYAAIAHRADIQRQLPGEAVLEPGDVAEAGRLRAGLREELPVQPIDFSPDPRDTVQPARHHRPRGPVLVARR